MSISRVTDTPKHKEVGVERKLSILCFTVLSQNAGQNHSMRITFLKCDEVQLFWNYRDTENYIHEELRVY
jgi:hypothetical protein